MDYEQIKHFNVWGVESSRITNIVKDGDKFSWQLIENNNEKFSSTFYSTNKRGEGVFLETPNGQEQLTGTSQFSLKDCSPEEIREKLKEFHGL